MREGHPVPLPKPETRRVEKGHAQMLRNARTAVKFFVYGVIAGLLFAPQSGAELRKQLFGMLGETLNEVTNSIGSAGNDQTEA